jgi:hypothetical protein
MTGRAGRVYGRLVITTCRQPAEAPWIDQATVDLEDGRTAGGYALFPRRPGGAFVVAWIGHRARNPRPLAHPVHSVRSLAARLRRRPSEPMTAGGYADRDAFED